MNSIKRGGCWGLADARAHAAAFLSGSGQNKPRPNLLSFLGAEDAEIRKRAADVARRITEKDDRYFHKAFGELASILAETPVAESRTRWHLGLVVARTARSAAETLAAAELMWLLARDTSNVVRCSAVEGLGRLALRNPALRGDAEEYLHQAQRSGTRAMQCRATHALRKLGYFTG